MSKYLFLFDLDSTITKKGILPQIAKTIGMHDEVNKITQLAMAGHVSFEKNFKERVNLLKDIPISVVNDIVSQIPLNPLIVDFICKNNNNCKIITSNLDVWIDGLMKVIGVENNYFCSN